ncbi:MAG: TonB family protein [Pseudomonadota bacterium]
MIKHASISLLLSGFALGSALSVSAQEAAEAKVENLEITVPILEVEGPTKAAPRPYLKDYGVIRPRPADYPPEAWVADEEGRTQIVLAVSAEGMVTGCDVVESSGSETLDNATCAIAMDRGKFEPAQDADGMPVASEFGFTHRWRKRSPEFSGPMNISVRFLIEADGTVSECEVLERSGNIEDRMREMMEKEPCPGVGKTGRPPYRDENGVPVARRVTLTIATEVVDP